MPSEARLPGAGTPSPRDLRGPLSPKRSTFVRSQWSTPALVQLLDHRRKDVAQVADDAEVDEIEDRGLLVLIDGHDRLGRLHAGAVLDRARDAVGDVKLGRDRLAGLADLEAVRLPTRVHRCARRAHGGTES